VTTAIKKASVMDAPHLTLECGTGSCSNEALQEEQRLRDKE
jgi:hypothetical protein